LCFSSVNRKMMDFDEYEFKLDAYSPATIPLERLAAYMSALAKLLGNQSSVHFEKLEQGSTCHILKIDNEAIPKVSARLNKLFAADAANDAKIAADEVNKLCAADNATAELYKRKAGKRIGNIVFLFEGKNLPKPVRYGPFTEPITFDGELVKIGGKDKTAHAQIIDPDGTPWNGEMTRELAAEIAQHLYKGTLRINGQARWLRGDNGKWEIQQLKITGFSVLKEETLWDATDRLRNLKDTEWHTIENVDKYISDLRGSEEALH
jgi:hypothetical protein